MINKCAIRSTHRSTHALDTSNIYAVSDMITHAEQIITHTIYCGHQNLIFFQKCFIWYWVINEETKSPLQAAPVDIDKSLSSHQRENYINNASMGMKTVEWKISTWMIQRRSFGENLEKVVEDIQQLFQLGCASIQHLKVFNLLCESPPAVVKEHKPFHLTFMFTPKNTGNNFKRSKWWKM